MILFIRLISHDCLGEFDEKTAHRYNCIDLYVNFVRVFGVNLCQKAYPQPL